MLKRLGPNPYGELVPTIKGQQAFVPPPLPRELPLSPRLAYVLDEASRAVASLSGVGETVQNPLLLIRPFLRREALLSSRIEGTVASLSDVFSHEASRRQTPSDDVREVINYIEALEYGIEMLDRLPISFRLVNEVHQRLMTGVRGEEKRPGEFRTGQVWIGTPGSSIRNARFVPPPPDRLRKVFLDWESFANEPLLMPPLVRCAMMHYQFEAIHPYADGNGRVGRLLIVLYLVQSGVLTTPLLYLSAYFERDRQRYYDELLNVSITGDWERWLDYFLRGVVQQSRDTRARIRRIRELQDDYRETLQSRRATASEFRLLDELFASPFTTVRNASEFLDMSVAGAQGVLNRLESAGIIRVYGGLWPRTYFASEVLAQLEADMDID